MLIYVHILFLVLYSPYLVLHFFSELIKWTHYSLAEESSDVYAEVPTKFLED